MSLQIQVNKIPTTLTKYIFKEIFSFFFICFFAFTGLLLTFQMLKFANLVVNKGVEASQIGLIFISIIPTFAEIALPLSCLIGVMLAISRLSGDSEIIVLRASGISLHTILIPVLLFGSLVTGVALFVSSTTKPWGFSTLSNTLFSIAKTKTTAGLSGGVFNKLGALTLYSNSINDKTGELKGVLIDDKRDELSRSIIFSRRGQIISQADKGSIIILLSEGTIHELVKNKYILTKFDANRIVLKPDEINKTTGQEKGRAAKELTNAQIKESKLLYLKLQKEMLNDKEVLLEELPLLLQEQLSDQEITEETISKKLARLEIESNLRLSLPFATLILSLLGLTLGVAPARMQRSWGSGISVLIGMGAFITYYGMLSVGLGLADGRTVPPFFAAWFPNLMVLLASLFFLSKISEEKWASVPEAFFQKGQYLYKAIQNVRTIIKLKLK
jgi:LPS export ABC transporter permease LptF